MDTTPDPLMSALSTFARTLAQGFEITDVLYDLTERVSEVLAVPAAGVSLARDGRLQHVTSLNELAVTVEVVQELLQEGPCVDAYRSSTTVTVVDLSEEADRWADFRGPALEAGVVALAGIPFTAAGRTLGALNLYDVVPGSGQTRTSSGPAYWRTWLRATSSARHNWSKSAAPTSNCSWPSTTVC